jgi:GntR family transcriptional regulator, transcriptional repressor for pyruvate dehydrogenase complex
MSLPFESGPLPVVSRERLTDQTAAALREFILRNHLAPGTRLPSETVMAKSLGVSRNVLRQAVASLQGLGMLRVNQGSGTYVADLADTEIFQQIAAWMSSDTLSEQDYLEVRGIWERGIYQLVLQRAQTDDFDRLDALAAEIAESHNQEETDSRHQTFHEELLAVTGNPFLVTIDTIVRRFFWEFGYQRGLVRKPPTTRVLGGHGEIAQLLRLRDPALIGRMIDVHLAPHLSVDDEA